MVQFLFKILDVSGSIGYLFKSGFGSDNTHNPKYHKTRSIWYLCQVWIGSDLFLSDQIRFGFSGLVYLSNLNHNGFYLIVNHYFKNISMILPTHELWNYYVRRYIFQIPNVIQYLLCKLFFFKYIKN